eukprot:GHVU01199445.1.p1 GENE.GHVU01199445.1~~GHVU01199445.1.p1  ORF type:complete len:151 (+),score=3.99 GHVU01199445.1:65-517(+)
MCVRMGACVCMCLLVCVRVCVSVTGSSAGSSSVASDSWRPVAEEQSEKYCRGIKPTNHAERRCGCKAVRSARSEWKTAATTEGERKEGGSFTDPAASGTAKTTTSILYHHHGATSNSTSCDNGTSYTNTRIDDTGSTNNRGLDGFLPPHS